MDIGGGGAGFLCPFSRSLLATPRGEPFNVAVQFGPRHFTLPGKLSYARLQGSHVRIGVEFDRDRLASHDPATLALLNDLIAELQQREERWERQRG